MILASHPLMLSSVAPVANVVLKPANMTYAQAAGLGIATVTGVRVVDVTGVSSL